jgi:hypothetical protein
MNIEHSTSNIEHRMIAGAQAGWTLDVQCLAEAKRREDWWMFDVFIL